MCCCVCLCYIPYYVLATSLLKPTSTDLEYDDNDILTLTVVKHCAEEFKIALHKMYIGVPHPKSSQMSESGLRWWHTDAGVYCVACQLFNMTTRGGLMNYREWTFHKLIKLALQVKRCSLPETRYSWQTFRLSCWQGDFMGGRFHYERLTLYQSISVYTPSHHWYRCMEQSQ